jgi:SAM-dependent methyltransferase
MHASVKTFLRQLPQDLLYNREILEVGSLNVNGSARDVLAQNYKNYVGTDLRPGPRVDMVVDACDLTQTFGEETFDAVVSTETLEHVERWRPAIYNMVGVLRDKGILILTTRSVGFPHHEYPYDCWRFQPETMREILSRLGMTKVSVEDDPEVPGVFVIACKDQDAFPADGKVLWDIHAVEAPSV